MLGTKGAVIPDQWPANLSTQFNVNTPMNVTLNNDVFQAYMSVSNLFVSEISVDIVCIFFRVPRRHFLQKVALMTSTPSSTLYRKQRNLFTFQ